MANSTCGGDLLYCFSYQIIPVRVKKGELKSVCCSRHTNTRVDKEMEIMMGNIVKLKEFKVKADAAKAGKETGSSQEFSPHT